MTASIRKRKRFLIILFGLVLLVVALAALSVYFYRQSRRSSPDAVAASEVNALVREVGKHIILPEGETPTVATVSDPDKLKDQSFFADAKVGYKVLIYSEAKKAILYDPVAKKIVTVAPINVGTQTPQQ